VADARDWLFLSNEPAQERNCGLVDTQRVRIRCPAREKDASKFHIGSLTDGRANLDGRGRVHVALHGLDGAFLRGNDQRPEATCFKSLAWLDKLTFLDTMCGEDSNARIHEMIS